MITKKVINWYLFNENHLFMFQSKKLDKKKSQDILFAKSAFFKSILGKTPVHKSTIERQS